MSYDFSPKTFSEFLKVNNLSLQEGVLAVCEEYNKLKMRESSVDDKCSNCR